jgi:hypothetical protein
VGASAWSWQVPYQQDLGAALEQARREAYAQGSFYREEPTSRARSMGEEDYVAEELAEMRKRLVEEFGDDAWEPGDTETREEWRAAQIEVTDPDSLLESQPFSGTHSIIDMTGVSATSAPHMVAPVPAEELDELFGTRRPAATAVAEAIENGALGGLERWQGRYVIGYDADVPQAIYFVGISGD